MVVTAGAFERSDDSHILDVTGFGGREGRLLRENPGKSHGAIGRGTGQEGGIWLSEVLIALEQSTLEVLGGTHFVLAGVPEIR